MLCVFLLPLADPGRVVPADPGLAVFLSFRAFCRRCSSIRIARLRCSRACTADAPRFWRDLGTIACWCDEKPPLLLLAEPGRYPVAAMVPHLFGFVRACWYAFFAAISADVVTRTWPVAVRVAPAVLG